MNCNSFKLVLGVCLLLNNTSTVYAQSTVNDESVSFQNDICIPSTLYMLSQTQNDVFVQPLIKRWRPYNDVVRFSGMVDFSRRLETVASVSHPKSGDSLTLQLVNLDAFETIKEITSIIEVGEKGVGKDTVCISIIGDSFTQGAFYKDALLVEDYIPKLKMVGMRKVDGFNGQFDEGRGGWTLRKYFTISKQPTNAYNGFWQPKGRWRYWGSIEYWKLANQVKANPAKEWTFVEKYHTERFISEFFDPKTGYKINPQQDDLMFSSQKNSFVVYNGRKWIEIDETKLDWGFDYQKYLLMWDLETPSMLFEFLGLNDFRDAENPSEIDFSVWNRQMEELIVSYKKAAPNGKFALMIPSSSCGILSNRAGDFTIKQNAAMWEVRKNIIENFDKRSSEGIYVIDAGISIDNTFGTKFIQDEDYTLPFTEYAGDERLEVHTGNPHPYPNYPAMGIALAAFIQKYRD